MSIFYLRFLIGGLNVLFVVIVACVTLALALTISFKSLRDNADTAVSRLGAVTGKKVDAFFATPQRHLDDIGTANARFKGFGGFPSESPSFNVSIAGSPASEGGEVLQMYRQVVSAIMTEVDSRYLGILIMFFDGSYTWQVPSCVPALQARILGTVTTWPTGPTPGQQHPIVTSGHVIPSGVENAQISAVVAATMATFPLVTDARIPAVRASLDARYAADTKSAGSTVAWGQLYLTAAIGQEFYFLRLVRPIVNQSNDLLGYISLNLGTSDVSALLTEGQLTPATRLVIYDTDGFLFGASSGVKTHTTVNHTGPTTDPGCTTTNQSAALFPSDAQLKSCRYHIRDTPVAMVQAAVKKDLAFFMQGTTAGAVRLVGSQYVYVQKLPTLEGARAFTIAMVVPEEDMIGDAAKILPICAGVTAGVVVLVAAVSLVLVWLVLRPLQGIAERMGKAARLEADDEAVNVSSLVEIGDLQRAFLEMRDELSRIRAFVPQSLLHANDQDTEEEEVPDPGSLEASLEPAAESKLDLRSRTSLTNISSCGTDSPTHDSPLRTRSLGASRISAGPPGVVASPAFVIRRRKSSHVIASTDGGTSTTASRPRARLQLSSSVRCENVSVLSLNLRGYNAAVKGGLSVERVAATVEAVLRIAQQEKGVVDSFHGDRFMISFNAVKPAVNHDIRAALVAARVAASLSSDASTATGKTYALPVTAGVATGPAQVGNLGSSEMKRFSIVGPVVSQAACLERLCKLYPGASCLVPQRLFADLRTAVLVKTVDYVRVPFAERPMLVGAVLRELSQAADDEWMYQLQQVTGGDERNSDYSPDSALHAQHNNEVWEALLAGRSEDATALFDTLDKKSCGRVLPLLRAAVVSLPPCAPVGSPSPAAVVDPGDPRQGQRAPCLAAAHDLGEFYAGALLATAPPSLSV